MILGTTNRIFLKTTTVIVGVLYISSTGVATDLAADDMIDIGGLDTFGWFGTTIFDKLTILTLLVRGLAGAQGLAGFQTTLAIAVFRSG